MLFLQGLRYVYKEVGLGDPEFWKIVFNWNTLWNYHISYSNVGIMSGPKDVLFALLLTNISPEETIEAMHVNNKW